MDITSMALHTMHGSRGRMLLLLMLCIKPKSAARVMMMTLLCGMLLVVFLCLMWLLRGTVVPKLTIFFSAVRGRVVEISVVFLFFTVRVLKACTGVSCR